MLKHFLAYWLFAFTMFAAGAPALGAEGGGEGAAGDGGEGAGDIDLGDGGEGDGGEGEGAIEGEIVDDLDPDAPKEKQKVDETADFKSLVSRRLLTLKKEAPELTGIFQKYPKVQEQVEAAFRRDMAYRELYPTVAEAREMREQFPNGMADVQQLMGDLEELGQVDVKFQTRDANGAYAGHAALVQNLFIQDRPAAVALMKTVPKEWARQDPESYNEVMGQIVGATLARAEIPDWLAELKQVATEAKQPALAASLDKMLRWAQGYLKGKPAPTEEERRLQGREEEFRRAQNETKTQDFNRFKTTFFSESEKLQQNIIRKHPAMAVTLQQKSLTEAKKKEIVSKVQTRIREHLKGSPAFMKKLTPLYHAGNLDEAIKLQRVQWSYPWMLNKYVRQVLAEETPGLVKQNREKTRTAGATSQRPPAKAGTTQQPTKRTAPYQEAGFWKKADGSRFSTAEILRGLHLK